VFIGGTAIAAEAGNVRWSGYEHLWQWAKQTERTVFSMAYSATIWMRRILPHSGMFFSRVIVASFKCSPTIPSAEPRLAGAPASTPPSDRLRGRRPRGGLSLSEAALSS